MSLNLQGATLALPATGINSGGNVVFEDYTYPFNGGSQYAVSSVTGFSSTIAGHTVSQPFSVTFFPPKQLKALSFSSVNQGLTTRVPRNKWTALTRCGVEVLQGTAPQILQIRSEFEIPANAETNNLERFAAAVAVHCTALQNRATALVNTMRRGG